MLQLFKKSFLIFMFITLMNAEDLKEVNKKDFTAIQSLNLIMQAQIKVNQAYDIGSLYILNTTIQGNKQTIFLTKDKKYIIAGNVMNSTTGEPQSLPIDLSHTIGKEALTFGSGKDEYVLFTDPECPYCKNFESYFPQLEKFVKIRVFFYPLSFHKNAKDLSIYMMNQKNNQEKINAMLNTTEKSEHFINRKIDEQKQAELEKNLEIQMNIAQELNVSGTPTLFSKDGKKLVWVELLKKYNINLK